MRNKEVKTKDIMNSRFWSHDQAGLYLGLSRASVYRLERTKKGFPKSFKILGYRSAFDRDAIIKWGEALLSGGAING